MASRILIGQVWLRAGCPDVRVDEYELLHYTSASCFSNMVVMICHVKALVEKSSCAWRPFVVEMLARELQTPLFKVKVCLKKRLAAVTPYFRLDLFMFSSSHFLYSEVGIV